MKGFLLDTSVVSELIGTAPDPRVLQFVGGRDDLWLSVVVLHELEFGVRPLPRGRRRDGLRQALSGIENHYGDRVLPVTAAEARHAARLRAHARRAGRILHLPDALIAGTAVVQDPRGGDPERARVRPAGSRRRRPVDRAGASRTRALNPADAIRDLRVARNCIGGREIRPHAGNGRVSLRSPLSYSVFTVSGWM